MRRVTGFFLKSINHGKAFFGKPGVDFSLELVTNATGATSGCSCTEKRRPLKQQYIFDSADRQMVSRTGTHNPTAENHNISSFG